MTTVQLPAPMLMTTPLTQALGRRRTSRQFSPQALDLPLLSAVLWACAGRTDSEGRRTVPSARNLRTVSAYVFDRRGVWLYDEAANTLTLRVEGDLRAETTTGQDFVQNAPVSLVFVADLNRCGDQLGELRELCLAVDAGCMVQAAQLAAAAMGLSSVARASIDADRLRERMGLDANHKVLMAVTLGFPAD